MELERLDGRILIIRKQRVILDGDLARVYGVSTKHLNQQVRRNRHRFPGDFMFQLTAHEKLEVVTKCDHLWKLKYSPQLPLAFTEHGAVMSASVLNSEIAIRASVEVVRAFLRLRRMVSENRDLAKKLAALERKYDGQFKIVFDQIRGLMEAPEEAPGIGFKP